MPDCCELLYGPIPIPSLVPFQIWNDEHVMETDRLKYEQILGRVIKCLLFVYYINYRTSVPWSREKKIKDWKLMQWIALPEKLCYDVQEIFGLTYTIACLLKDHVVVLIVQFL